VVESEKTAKWQYTRHCEELTVEIKKLREEVNKLSLRLKNAHFKQIMLQICHKYLKQFLILHMRINPDKYSGGVSCHGTSAIKGTGTCDYNCVNVVWFDRPCLGEIPADIHNFLNCPFNFLLN
jgi:hypothetical protein